MNPFYENNIPQIQLKTITERYFPVHIHPQIELLVVFGGKQGMFIQGREYVASPGDLIIVYPNIVHSLVEKGESDVDASLLIFTPDIISDYKHVFLSQMPEDPLLRLGEAEFAELKAALKLMYRVKPDDKYAMLLKGYIHIVFAYIMGNLKLIDRPLSTVSEQYGTTLLQIINFVSNHFNEPLTLEYMADHLNVSSIHLSHVFSSQLKINFRAYINSIRINYAQRLLMSSSLSITDICYTCGYNNQKTFNRAFIEISGITPREYRKGRHI